jgi:hypothetical protein
MITNNFHYRKKRTKQLNYLGTPPPNTVMNKGYKIEKNEFEKATKNEKLWLGENIFWRLNIHGKD